VAVSRANLIVALYGPMFYVGKLLVPLGLSYYELPSALHLSVWQFLIYCAAVPAITVVLVCARRRWPAALAAWLCYLVLLAPTLGLFRYGAQIAADRYTYLPSLAWATLAGGGLLSCGRAPRSGRFGLFTTSVVGGLIVAVLLSLGSLTWKQAQVWHDSERFWHHVLATNPDSYVAHHNLGVALLEGGRPDEAIAHLKRALQLRPDNADVNIHWGVILAGQGRLDEALPYMRRAVELAPTHAEAHNNLGAVLARQGKRDEAIDHFVTALRLDPDLTDAQRNLDAVLGLRRQRSSP